MEKSHQSSDTESLSISVEESIALFQDLLGRAERLLEEYKAYQTLLHEHQKSKAVEARIFRRGVESEVKSLRSLADGSAKLSSRHDESFDTEEQAAKRMHVLRSSNLPFYEAIWETAKSSQGIRALGKRVYWPADGTTLSSTAGSARANSNSAMIDLVSNDGLLWTKVSIASEKRLLFDMAKEGWEGYAGQSDSDKEQNEFPSSTGLGRERSIGKLELVKLAEQLRDAACSTRIRHQHPTVRFVLPRIMEGVQPDVDAMLEDIRATGALVEQGPQIYSGKDTSPPKPLRNMLPRSHLPPLTPTLNIDCTILLALVSDISHMQRSQLPPSPTSRSGHYHSAILKQIKAEEARPLLPNDVYPILCGRELVCTDLAAQRMKEIARTMGTGSEQARAGIILGEGDFAGMSENDLRANMRQHSVHSLPDDIILPIKVTSYTVPKRNDLVLAQSSTTILSPPPASFLSRFILYTSLNLSPINSSVFFFGWSAGIVTITSNKVVAHQIEKAIDEFLDAEEAQNKTSSRILRKRLSEARPDDFNETEHNERRQEQEIPDEKFSTPKLWICDSARSLIGKERQGGLRP